MNTGAIIIHDPFQSTHPVRGATETSYAEGTQPCPQQYFNPRTP